MAVGAAENYIFRRERSHIGPVGQHFAHGAIAKIAHRGRPGSTATGTMSIAQAGKVAASEIAHVIYGNNATHFSSHEGGILVDCRDIVVDKRYIHSAQAVYTRRGRYIQEIICRRAVLRLKPSEGQRKAQCSSRYLFAYSHCYTNGKEARLLSASDVFRSEGHNAIGCYNYLFLSVKMSDSLFEITFAATEQARYQFRVAAVANGNTVA